MFKSKKKMFALILAVIIARASLVAFLNLAGIVSACIKRDFWPFEYLLGEVLAPLSVLSLMLFPAKMCFDELFEEVSWPRIVLACLMMFVGYGVVKSMGESEISDFKYVDFPPYISEWPTKTVYMEKKYDYSQKGAIKFKGYFDFLSSNDFLEKPSVEVVENPAYTEGYKVEVRYKGEDSELYISDWDEDGVSERNLSVWPVSYDWEPGPEDYVYMYKYKVNFRYTDRLAVEKITIYTAYPRMVDVSRIESWY